MKKNGKYRFTLQFDSNSDENKLVGECLEQLGHQKSKFVITAILGYLRDNPDFTPDSVDFSSIFSQYNNNIRTNRNTTQSESPKNSPSVSPEQMDSMLDCLDLF